MLSLLAFLYLRGIQDCLNSKKLHANSMSAKKVSGLSMRKAEIITITISQNVKVFHENVGSIKFCTSMPILDTHTGYIIQGLNKRVGAYLWAFGLTSKST